MLSCKEFILAGDSPHITVQCIATLQCRPGDLTGVGMLWHSPRPRQLTASVKRTNCLCADDKLQASASGPGETWRLVVPRFLSTYCTSGGHGRHSEP